MHKPRRRPASTDALLRRVLRVPSFRGKHVILVHGKVYAATSSEEVRRLFDKARRDFPDETPTMAYVPRADALVLDTFAVHFAGYRTTFSVRHRESP